MKKYLEDLRQELKKQNLTNEEIEEIISDHEEMIQTAMAEGLSEEEIKVKFGKPDQLAKELGDSEPKVEATQTIVNEYTLYKSFDSKEDEISVFVKLISEDVTYQASENSMINIYYHGRGDIEKYDINYKNGKFELATQKGLGIGISFTKRNDIDFIIELPKTKIIAEFAHQAVSSDVELKNLLTKKFKLTTTSGDVNILSSKLGKAEWHTVSGDLNVHDTDFEELDSSQVSGDINMEQVTVNGDLRCNSVSGDIQVSDSSCRYFDLNTVSGDMDGKEFYPEKVSLKSVSGDMSIKNKENRPISILKNRSLSGDISIN